MISAGESLSFFPERHPRVRQRPGIRRFIVKKYFKVFYRVHRETMMVEILRCWDGRRGTEPPISEEGN
jgi:plasmid stabilization system protein ParE